MDGYGIRIAIERGQLIVCDGVGRSRRELRVPKVGHGISRLVIVGHTGTVSLEALRWLNRVGIHFAHIDTDGKALTATAHEAVGNSRLRRAQALAADTATGLDIVCTLLDHKLAGQARNTRTVLNDDDTAERIEQHRTRLGTADTITSAREIEATAAGDYFTSWIGNVGYRWANNDRDLIPDHWTTFASRRSLLTRGNNARATDPINAALNYLYALGEIECRRACLILGLDPGLGFLHADTPTRNSLALDLIEAIRPDIDAHLLHLCQTRTFTIRDFTETDDGHTRALPPFTHQLAATLPQWEAAIAPIAEHVAHLLADSSPYNVPKRRPLTGAVRSATASEHAVKRRKSTTTSRPPRHVSQRNRYCIDCGADLPTTATIYCKSCWPKHQSEYGRRAVAASAAAIANPAKRAERNRNISATKLKAIDETMRELGHRKEDWERLAPMVGRLTLKQIMDSTGLAISQASRVKSGKFRPHPRHWRALAAAFE